MIEHASNTQSPNLLNEFLDIAPDNSEVDEFGSEFEPQRQILSLEEYKKLIQLIPKSEKYRNAVKKLDKVIKSKDAKIRELEKIQRHDSVNVSHLSVVSIQ